MTLLWVVEFNKVAFNGDSLVRHAVIGVFSDYLQAAACKKSVDDYANDVDYICSIVQIELDVARDLSRDFFLNVQP